MDVQKTACVDVNIKKTSVVSNLAAWQKANTKNEVENESHPWSNNCPNGELDPVLLACLPSIASSVEYIKIQKAAKKKQ